MLPRAFGSIGALARCLGLYVAAVAVLSSTGRAGVCAAGTVVQGVDVSSLNGTITASDWVKVSGAGISFAYTRATDGTSFTDPQFAGNYASIKAAGMTRGAYHFFEPAQDPVMQADFFLSTIGTLDAGDLPPMLDVEITGGQTAATIAANIQLWINRVQQVTGRAPVIYTSHSFWDSSVQSASFSNYPLWVSQVGVTCPTLPAAWTNWVFFQYSFTGSVTGITGNVDLDEFNGSLTALSDLAGDIQVTLTATPNPSPLRRSMTFTAAVDSGVATMATGSVVFMDGAKALAPSIALNSGQASFKTNQLAPGRHKITAVYSGDINFVGNSSGPLIFYLSLKPH